MEPLYDAMEPEQAAEIEQLARVMYEAREHRRLILEQYHTDDPAEVLARIATMTAAGESEHPAYEHYLAVCILDETRNAARSLMAARLREDDPEIDVPAAPHLVLHEALAKQVGKMLAAAPELRQDALVLRLANDVELVVHYASPSAYSLRWTTPDGQELGIDTAPGHRGIETGPHHLHLPNGHVTDDPLTRPGQPPWDNLRAVIDALLDDPLFAKLR
jgi:hypothetical protein